MPSTGYTDDETYKLKYTTYNLAYWASTGERTNGAYSYIANYEQGYMTTTNRYVAHCVRAVCGVSDITATATQNVSTTIQDASNIVHGTTVVIPDSSSTVQPNNKAKQTAKTIQKTANTIKKTTKTIKTLHNILKH